MSQCVEVLFYDREEAVEMGFRSGLVVMGYDLRGLRLNELADFQMGVFAG